MEREPGLPTFSGYRALVSLLENDEAAQLELGEEAEVATSNNIRFISFPIPDRGVPASTPGALQLLKNIVQALEQGRNVAVHCRQGLGRSALIAAGALVTSGMSPQKAIDIVSAARGEKVPETPAQLQWIHELPAERPVLTS